MLTSDKLKVYLPGNGSTTGTVDWSEDGSSKEAEMNATARLIIDKTVNSTGNEPPEHASDKGNLVYSVELYLSTCSLMSYICASGSYRSIESTLTLIVRSVPQ